MKALHDPDRLLADGLTAIREQYKLPTTFPAEVEAAAEQAARRQPTGHADRTDVPFVTLDPASSTDLDQAFAIEASGADIILRYAIADVGFWISEGDAIDLEAWKRGTTCYLPGGKVSLYPKALSEAAASLLPDGDRPAVLFTTRVDPDGNVRLESAERALIRSRAKLAYETTPGDLFGTLFVDLASRIAAAEERRGASRVDPPEQELERDAGGHYHLSFRPLLASETRNAAMSLATNMAVADALFHAGTGLFRVMPAPDERAVLRLRGTAKAFGIDWPPAMPLEVFEKGLDGHKPREAAFLMAVRRAGSGASYVPCKAGEVPWHAAMAATYAHATAPLRRLADRYVIEAALAVASARTRFRRFRPPTQSHGQGRGARRTG